MTWHLDPTKLQTKAAAMRRRRTVKEGRAVEDQTGVTLASAPLQTQPPMRKSERPRHEWGPDDRGQLGVVCSSHAVQHFYPAALAVSYPFIVVSFRISYGTLGIVLGIARVLGGVLQGVAGFFEKASARVPLSAQSLAFAVSTVLAGIAPGFPLFGAARCVGATAPWPQHSVGNSLLLRRFPTRRAFALSCTPPAAASAPR